MANLIITVIGLALVAIAALAGIFYGGQAFGGASANAIAGQIINEVQQYKTAALAFEANSGLPYVLGRSACSPPAFANEAGNYTVWYQTLIGGTGNSCPPQTTAYLSSVPILPIFSGYTVYVSELGVFTSSDGVNYAFWHFAPITPSSITGTDTLTKVCQAINNRLNISSYTGAMYNGVPNDNRGTWAGGAPGTSNGMAGAPNSAYIDVYTNMCTYYAPNFAYISYYYITKI